MAFDEGGEAEWIHQYERLTRMEGMSREATKLVQRAEWMGRKLSGLFALLNGEPKVSAAAVRAAVALIDYSVESVNRIAATLEQREKYAAVRAHATKILAYVEIGPKRASAVREAAKLSAKDFTAGLQYLTDQCSPPRVIVEEVLVTGGKGAVNKRPTVRLA